MGEPAGSWTPGPGSFLLSSPWRTVWAEGVRHRLTAGSVPEAVTQARRVLAELDEDALIVGALPFDPSMPPWLTVPARVRYTRPEPPPVLQQPAWGEPRQHATHEQFRLDVERVLAELDGGAADKVVLARALDLQARGPVDVGACLARLAERNPEAYTFAVDLPAGLPDGPPDPVTFLGASPELLVALRDGRITVNPLAGTRPRHQDPATDQALAAELLGSAKDLHEHHLVVEHITRRLAPLCDELDVPDRPELLATSDAWHLSTVIRATVADPEVTSLHLAQAMHPTPAVCGTPTDAAAGLITHIESVERGWYAGAVGWCDAGGDGEWIVALRCALVWRDRARLYAGVGVVPGSDPHDELAETSTKFRTALFGLGFDPRDG